MMNKISIALILTVLVANVFLAYKIKHVNKSSAQLVELLRIKEEDLNNKSLKLKKIISNQYFTQTKQFTPNIKLLNSLGETKSIGILIESRPKLFLVIPSEACDLCYYDLFQRLESVKETIGEQNLIVLTDKDRLRETIGYFGEKNFNVETFGLDKIHIESIAKDLSTPIFFTLNKELVCQNVAIPDVDNLYLFDEYIRQISKSYL